MLRDKGRLVAPRKSSKISPAQRVARARTQAVEKLGEPEINRTMQLIQSMNSVEEGKKEVMDGIIMSLLQRNLSNLQIRSIHRFGNSRINRIRKLMRNPSLLNKRRPKPIHAVDNKDLENIKSHLSTLETEDGFPCAHRRPKKFFVEEGLR